MILADFASEPPVAVFRGQPLDVPACVLPAIWPDGSETSQVVWARAGGRVRE